MRRIIIFILIFQISLIHTVKTQLNDSIEEKKSFFHNYDLEFKTYYGFIYAHHKSFRYFINGHIPAFELNICKQTTGEKIWQQFYDYPTLGFGYYHADFANRAVLGTANSLYYFISVPILKKHKIDLNYNFAFGIAYLNKNFDTKNNYYNLAISSHFNVHLNYNINVKIKLTKRIQLINGAGITHFSNGAVKTPNKGLNLISYHTGLKYSINMDPKLAINSDYPEFLSKNEFSVIYNSGFKEVDFNNNKYLTSSFSVNVERCYKYTRKAGAGLDLFFDASIKNSFEEDSIFDSRQSDYLYAGFHLSYDLVYGNTSFTLQSGVYIFRQPPLYKYVYQRFGLRYRFCNNYFVNLTLKTYFAKADFIEWGIGYRFQKK